jgi:hypothetical protein
MYTTVKYYVRSFYTNTNIAYVMEKLWNYLKKKKKVIER